jgi:hypothetical protein
MTKKVSFDTTDCTRKSVYVKNKTDKALKIMAALEETNEYIILNKALEQFIPKKYLDMADMAQEKK